MKIAIIGAGVSGLTTGIELIKRGYQTVTYAREITPNTTSDVAGAIWAPYKIEPQKRVLNWAIESLKTFKQISYDNPETGVLFKTHTILHDKRSIRSECAKHLEQLPVPDYVPDSYKPYSYTAKTPLIDPTKYMPYLMDLYLKNGGVIQQADIEDINTLFKDHHFVINCSGLGAKKLVNDNAMYPIRGHVLKIEKIPEFADCMIKFTGALTYIFTRSEDCLIGGTALEGVWDLQPDKDTQADIIARVKAICPVIKEFKIIQEMVGLRPGRSEVRLEIEKIDHNRTIIHNYGHGGAGYTVSWGCAREVADLLDDFA